MRNRVLFLLGCLATSHAFLTPQLPMSEIRKSLDGTQLDWQFSVGVDQRFPLYGLQTEILGNDVSVVEQPHFTGMKGREAVSIKNGKWDLSWRDTSPRGCLTFELDVPESVSRNDAMLPSARLYVSHLVWSKAGLAQQRAYKETVTQRARQHLADRDEELSLWKETTNLFSKALHYRKYMKAIERYHYSGHAKALYIPAKDEQVLPIMEDFLLSTRGNVFMKHPMKPNKKVLLGDSTICGSNVLHS